MLRKVRERLRANKLLHGAYMRLKRTFRTELIGMTSRTEQEYLAKYGEELYKGDGEIVDLGCWLGSTTIPLVDGLLKNPAFSESGRKVFAYDLFIWFDWMNSSAAGTELSGTFVEGDSFVEEYLKRIGHRSEHVEVRSGDLKEIGWGGGQIEFLLVDAMKGWDLANAIIRDFYPSLIPGRSFVFHQDFAHYFTPWIHLIHWKLRDHFEFAYEVSRSQSVVFKCTKAIAIETVAGPFSFDSFAKDEVSAAFEYSRSRVSEDKLPNIAAAEVMWFLHQEKFDEAERLFSEFRSKNVPLKMDMITVQQLINAG
jgi:hypothetical protein